MLVSLSDEIEETIALVFENYKSLDEHSSSGLTESHKPSSGFISPALKPALKLYTLLHDIKSPESQLQLCKYFQVLQFTTFFYHFPYLPSILFIQASFFTDCCKKDFSKTPGRNKRICLHYN